ncbi:hypothetical protein HY524_00375 [Candidatus Berkelbacteria bacterium]|nr:hypothetical protein [Candidatus Berkelbacteria bacterium]
MKRSELSKKWWYRLGKVAFIFTLGLFVLIAVGIFFFALYPETIGETKDEHGQLSPSQQSEFDSLSQKNDAQNALRDQQSYHFLSDYDYSLDSNVSSYRRDHGTLKREEIAKIALTTIGEFIATLTTIFGIFWVLQWVALYILTGHED